MLSEKESQNIMNLANDITIERIDVFKFKLCISGNEIKILRGHEQKQEFLQKKEKEEMILVLTEGGQLIQNEMFVSDILLDRLSIKYDLPKIFVYETIMGQIIHRDAYLSYGRTHDIVSPIKIQIDPMKNHPAFQLSQKIKFKREKDLY